MVIPVSDRLNYTDTGLQVTPTAIGATPETRARWVLSVSGAPELLDTLEKIKQLPHIAILVIDIPLKKGFEKLQEMKKMFPSVKVLVLTTFNHEYAIDRMYRKGANGCLHLKTCTSSDVITALHAIYNKDYYQSDLITNRLYRNLGNDDKTKIKITDKEIEFLSHVCEDRTYRKIAEIMHIGIRTADSYRNNLSAKLGIKTRAGLIKFAISIGLVSDD